MEGNIVIWLYFSLDLINVGVFEMINWTYLIYCCFWRYQEAVPYFANAIMLNEELLASDLKPGHVDRSLLSHFRRKSLQVTLSFYSSPFQSLTGVRGAATRGVVSPPIFFKIVKKFGQIFWNMDLKNRALK